MDIYREQILDHYNAPQNWGRIPTATASAHVFNDSCGDKITIDVVVKETGNANDKIVENISFEAEGCAISIATASLLTEQAKNKRITELKKLGSNDILNLIGVELTPTRLKCALISLEALHKTLEKV